MKRTIYAHRFCDDYIVLSEVDTKSIFEPGDILFLFVGTGNEKFRVYYKHPKDFLIPVVFSIDGYNSVSTLSLDNIPRIRGHNEILDMIISNTQTLYAVEEVPIESLEFNDIYADILEPIPFYKRMIAFFLLMFSKAIWKYRRWKLCRRFGR